MDYTSMLHVYGLNIKFYYMLIRVIKLFASRYYESLVFFILERKIAFLIEMNERTIAGKKEK